MTNEELIKKIETQIKFEEKSKSEYNVGRKDAYKNILILFKQLEVPEERAVSKKDKVVIPQFVADWIVTHKDPIFDMCATCEMWGLNGDDGTTDFTKELANWFDDNAKTYYRACLDGYTIEPPKTCQVLVKFFDNEEYKTELTEDAAKELIEFLEAKR